MEPIDKNQYKDTSPNVNQSQSKWKDAEQLPRNQCFVRFCCCVTAKIKCINWIA